MFSTTVVFWQKVRRRVHFQLKSFLTEFKDSYLIITENKKEMIDNSFGKKYFFETVCKAH